MKEKEFIVGKWSWMMDYCNKNSLPPARYWCWDEAEEQYEARERVFYCSDCGNGAPEPCKTQCSTCMEFQAKGDKQAEESQ